MLKKLLVPAAILGLIVGLLGLSGLATASQQTATNAPGGHTTCAVDASGYCTVTHNLGYAPAGVVVTADRIGQLGTTDRFTATTFRVRWWWYEPLMFKPGTVISFSWIPAGGAGATVTPSPTVTPSVTPTTPTTTPASWSCTRTRADGNIGCPGNLSTPGYVDPSMPNSNGYTTYVNKDCWGNPECQYLLEANSPSDWQVTANEPAGNTGVRTYPSTQQLTNNWCPTDPGYKNCSVANTDTQVSQLTKLTSTYDETTPRNSGVIGQFAWDLWATGNTASPVNEIMVWVDNQGRGAGGADQVGTATIAGQDWTIYRYGGAGGTELIWSLGAPGEFKQQGSGTVDLLAILNSSIQKGFLSSDVKLSQVNAGWEICSTGGVDRTFKMNKYSVDLQPR